MDVLAAPTRKPQVFRAFDVEFSKVVFSRRMGQPPAKPSVAKVDANSAAHPSPEAATRRKCYKQVARYENYMTSDYIKAFQVLRRRQSNTPWGR